jgi:hypothetical protein
MFTSSIPWILYKMLHSTKADSVIDLTTMRETQSALHHMLGEKLNAVIFIITSSPFLLDPFLLESWMCMVVRFIRCMKLSSLSYKCIYRKLWAWWTWRQHVGCGAFHFDFMCSCTWPVPSSRQCNAPMEWPPQCSTNSLLQIASTAFPKQGRT